VTFCTYVLHEKEGRISAAWALSGLPNLCTRQLRAVSGRSSGNGQPAGADPSATFNTAPLGEPLRRKTDDQIPCDQTIYICGRMRWFGITLGR
jgi:hypothetical protein